ncbi:MULTISPECIES: DUF2637 domain-containing protein [unclassified Micromonospora]|uniref:DUF2637 domain-containing protein n=1 Tax=unclassified Micromonospora TaxID=2617518 RepID=UPI00098D4758|nr:MULTISPECIES: DUF2637 domain-containing protein [unclassified Micromonospora]MDI5939684.1 DUF2637 domain-containing protein [Micromonospora sp. DH15]OON32075.1 hypothetical protein BSA16_07795 [Micromonospora sp. Rc5]
MTATRLQRMQWAVRATLALGVAASVTANILHAQPNPISQAIAAWPPMALLITVELVTRVPVHRRSLGVIRVAAASAIAAIAAWISYHHMVGVVARYGETGTVPYLLPLSVDGLIIVASVSLVELAARRREAEPQPHTVPAEASAAPPPGQPIASAPAKPTPGTSDTSPPRQSPLSEPPPREVDESAHGRTPGFAGSQDDAQEAEGSETDSDLDAEPDDDNPFDETDGIDVDLAPDLVPLLPAARTARDELTREGRTVSRDALARRLRQNGHSIRNSAVSQLLATLRQETQPVNGARPTASV